MCWPPFERLLLSPPRKCSGFFSCAPLSAHFKHNFFCVLSYPVIIHLENHCTVPLQREMARLLTETLGDLLFVPEDSDAHSEGSIITEVKSKSPSVSSTSSSEETAPVAIMGADSTAALCTSTFSIDTNSSGSGSGGGKSSSRSRAKSNASNGGAAAAENSNRQQGHANHSHLQQLWSHLTPAQLQNKIIISVSACSVSRGLAPCLALNKYR